MKNALPSSVGRFSYGSRIQPPLAITEENILIAYRDDQLRDSIYASWKADAFVGIFSEFESVPMANHLLSI